MISVAGDSIIGQNRNLIQPKVELTTMSTSEHAHAQHADTCPICDQTLPPDRTDDVRERLREREAAAAAQERQKNEEQYAIRLRAAVESAKKEGQVIGAKEAIENSQARVDAMQQKLDEANQQASAEKEKRLTAEAAEAKRTAEAVKLAVQAKENELQAANFEDKEKLEKRLESLQAQLDETKAREQGEGRDIDLLEALKAAFPEDEIKQIKPGETGGADLKHDVIYNGQICGTILYDSRSRRIWKLQFVELLKKDQVSIGADHAVLTTSEFKTGTRQLDIHEGVIVTNKARVVMLARILRREVVKHFRAKLTEQERDGKTTRLYEYITSNDCQQLIERHSELTTKLSDIDIEEQETHRKVWKKRGTTIINIEKTFSDLFSNVDDILDEGGSR